MYIEIQKINQSLLVIKTNNLLDNVYWGDCQRFIVLSILIGAGAEEWVDGLAEWVVECVNVDLGINVVERHLEEQEDKAEWENLTKPCMARLPSSHNAPVHFQSPQISRSYAAGGWGARLRSARCGRHTCLWREKKGTDSQHAIKT